jgi:hypothetical protein
MRIFVHEYVCGGGLAGQPLPESLRREGWAMLRAVVEDFARCPGVEVVTLLDSRLSAFVDELSGATVDFVVPSTEAVRYGERTRTADFTLVIAPETHYLLYQRCCWTDEARGQLLGPTPSAVHRTGDKLLLGDIWRRSSIPTPAEVPYPAFGVETPYPIVSKPQRGAGSRGAFLIVNVDEFMATLRPFRAEVPDDGRYLQKHVPGMPASVSVLIGGGHTLALPAATQRLSDDGRFHYLGGSLPLPDDLNDRAQRLALRALAPIDGLAGYVGVDLILGEAADGGEDYAIEINPRLTTSYVGLRALAEFNLAETMLALALGRPLPERRYRDGVVEWTADGTVQGPTVQ